MAGRGRQTHYTMPGPPPERDYAAKQAAPPAHRPNVSTPKLFQLLKLALIPASRPVAWNQPPPQGSVRHWPCKRSGCQLQAHFLRQPGHHQRLPISQPEAGAARPAGQAITQHRHRPGSPSGSRASGNAAESGGTRASGDTLTGQPKICCSQASRSAGLSAARPGQAKNQTTTGAHYRPRQPLRLGQQRGPVRPQAIQRAHCTRCVTSFACSGTRASKSAQAGKGRSRQATRMARTASRRKSRTCPNPIHSSDPAALSQRETAAAHSRAAGAR